MAAPCARSAAISAWRRSFASRALASLSRALASLSRALASPAFGSRAPWRLVPRGSASRSRPSRSRASRSIGPERLVRHDDPPQVERLAAPQIRIVLGALDQVAVDHVPDAERPLAVVRVEAHDLAHAGGAVARELLVPVGLALVRRADDLDAELRRAALQTFQTRNGRWRAPSRTKTSGARRFFAVVGSQ